MPQPMRALIPGFETVREKRYGITSVDLLHWVTEDESDHADENENDEDAPSEDTHE